MNKDAIRTPEQSKKFNTLIGKLGIDKETKAEMVSAISNGRTTTSAHLTVNECSQLINKLEHGFATPQRSRELTILDKARYRLLCTLRNKGFKTPTGKPDRSKIDAYTMHYWGKKVAAMDMSECNKYIAVVNKWRVKYAKD